MEDRHEAAHRPTPSATPCRRDLVVSPGHGLFVRDAAGEHLIPAVHLVEGQTIVQEVPAEVDYVHVELDRARHPRRRRARGGELPSVGNRAEFQNAGLPLVLHPAFAPRAREAGRAPFVIAGPVLTASAQGSPSGRPRLP